MAFEAHVNSSIQLNVQTSDLCWYIFLCPDGITNKGRHSVSHLELLGMWHCKLSYIDQLMTLIYLATANAVATDSHIV